MYGPHGARRDHRTYRSGGLEIVMVFRGLIAAALVFIGVGVQPAEAAFPEVTSLGTPSASSVFAGYFVSSGVDGNPATDWFSDGVGAGAGSGGTDTESYYWEFPQDLYIERVELDPETIGGFGFDKIRIRVFDSAATMVYESAEITLTAFDVDITHTLATVPFGSKVEILLINHENPACGGFSELRIFGSTTPVPAAGSLGLIAMALAVAGIMLWLTKDRLKKREAIASSNAL